MSDTLEWGDDRSHECIHANLPSYSAVSNGGESVPSIQRLFPSSCFIDRRMRGSLTLYCRCMDLAIHRWMENPRVQKCCDERNTIKKHSIQASARETFGKYYHLRWKKT